MKAGWAVYNAGVWGTGMLKSDHLPHYFYLETSTPSDYILDDFTVLYLTVQDLNFSLMKSMK